MHPSRTPNNQSATDPPPVESGPSGQSTELTGMERTETTEASGSNGLSSNFSHTESRRPPQQYRGQARVEILRKLKREVVRFRTFQNWQSRAIQPNVLAKAGFFYYNDTDKVQCAFCLGIIGRWDPTDDPFAEHRRHFPRCPFVLGLPVGNIPIDVATGRERAVPTSSLLNAAFDSERARPEIRTYATTEKDLTSTNVHVIQGNRWEDLEIQLHSMPAMATFATLDSRLKTFQTWPRGLAQKPQELAESGLYYTGVSDEVKCFHCDGGLKGWDPTDNPWMEHAKWYPYCRHLILLKGKEFIKEVQTMKTAPLNAAVGKARAKELMNFEPALTALNMGLERCNVEKALMDQLERYGRGFSDLSLLVEAASANATLREPQENINGATGYSEQTTDSGFGAIASNPSTVNHVGAKIAEASVASSGTESMSGNSTTAEAAALSLIMGEKEESKEENVNLLCKICMENKVSIVILPCAHLCSCTNCASSLKTCPICRKQFKGYVRAFLC